MTTPDHPGAEAPVQYDTYSPLFREDWKIPSEFEDRLVAVLRDLEATTGKRFSIKLNQLGREKDCVIHPFSRVGRWRITKGQDRYSELNGEYATLEALTNRLHRFELERDQPRSINCVDSKWMCPECATLNSFKDCVCENHDVCKFWRMPDDYAPWHNPEYTRIVVGDNQSGHEVVADLEYLG